MLPGSKRDEDHTGAAVAEALSAALKGAFVGSGNSAGLAQCWIKPDGGGPGSDTWPEQLWFRSMHTDGPGEGDKDCACLPPTQT